MLIATTSVNGKKTLILGLEDANIKRLLNDEPIRKSLGEEPTIPELKDWDLVILGPEDLVRFVSRFGVRLADHSDKGPDGTDGSETAPEDRPERS